MKWTPLSARPSVIPARPSSERWIWSVSISDIHVGKNLYDAVPDDECTGYLSSPRPFLDKMIANKWLGNKTKQGYYKKTKDAKGKNVKLMLDIDTMEYVPAGKPKFDSISAAKKMENVCRFHEACIQCR